MSTNEQEALSAWMLGEIQLSRWLLIFELVAAGTLVLTVAGGGLALKPDQLLVQEAIVVGLFIARIALAVAANGFSGILKILTTLAQFAPTFLLPELGAIDPVALPILLTVIRLISVGSRPRTATFVAVMVIVLRQMVFLDSFGLASITSLVFSTFIVAVPVVVSVKLIECLKLTLAQFDGIASSVEGTRRDTAANIMQVRDAVTSGALDDAHGTGVELGRAVSGTGETTSEGSVPAEEEESSQCTDAVAPGSADRTSEGEALPASEGLRKQGQPNELMEVQPEAEELKRPGDGKPIPGQLSEADLKNGEVAESPPTHGEFRQIKRSNVLEASEFQQLKNALSQLQRSFCDASLSPSPDVSNDRETMRKQIAECRQLIGKLLTKCSASHTSGGTK